MKKKKEKEKVFQVVCPCCQSILWTDSVTKEVIQYEKKGAKKLDSIDVAQLRTILSSEGTRAGEYNLFDLVAIGIVERSKIPTVIFNGTNPENLIKAINKEKIGTKIVHTANK